MRNCKKSTYLPGKYSIVLMDVLLRPVTNVNSLKGNVDIRNVKSKCYCISLLVDHKKSIIISGSFVSSIKTKARGSECNSHKMWLLGKCNVRTFCVCSLNQKYTLAHQQMQQDYERLKQEENDKSNKLQELMYVYSVRQLPWILGHLLLKSEWVIIYRFQ